MSERRDHGVNKTGGLIDRKGEYGFGIWGEAKREREGGRGREKEGTE